MDYSLFAYRLRFASSVGICRSSLKPNRLENHNVKNLLRMSLFIIARAGLFLAVVTWIVGQWWNLGAVSDISKRYVLGVSLNCHGVLALRNKAQGSVWDLRVSRRRASQDDAGFMFGEGDPPVGRWNACSDGPIHYSRKTTRNSDRRGHTRPDNGRITILCNPGPDRWK